MDNLKYSRENPDLSECYVCLNPVNSDGIPNCVTCKNSTLYI